MDDTLGMGGVEGISDLDSDGEQSFVFQCTARNTVFERHTIQKFHDDKRFPIVLPDVINSANIGVIQCGRSLGLAPKATENLGGIGYIIGQELECHKTV